MEVHPFLDIGHYENKTEVLGNAFAEFWSTKRSMDISDHTMSDNNPRRKSFSRHNLLKMEL